MIKKKLQMKMNIKEIVTLNLYNLQVKIKYLESFHNLEINQGK